MCYGDVRFKQTEDVVLVKLEVDSHFFAGDTVDLLKVVNAAFAEIVRSTEQISPVLSQHLREIRCVCTDPHHSDLKLKFVIPVSFRRAVGDAHFEYKEASSRKQIFSHPSAEDVVRAFLHQDKDGQPVTDFWASRLGAAFTWGINAGKLSKKDAAEQLELEKIAGL